MRGIDNQVNRVGCIIQPLPLSLLGYHSSPDMENL